MRLGLGHRALGWVPGEARRALRVVGVPAGAPPAVPVNASARAGTVRDQPRRTRCPTTGAVNSESPDRCPATGGISPGPLNGRPAAGGLKHSDRRAGPETESCVESAWSGPRCLRRATSNPQRQHPSWGLWGERIIPTVNPGNRESCPQDFYGRKPWKIQTTQPLSQAPGRKKTPCTTPPAIFPKLAASTATASPSTCASVAGTVRARPTAGAAAS